MRVSGITNTNFKANPIKIVAEENKGVQFLYKTIMDATHVTSEFHPGQVIYRMGAKESNIEIINPVKGFKEFLDKLGIKFSEME